MSKYIVTITFVAKADTAQEAGMRAGSLLPIIRAINGDRSNPLVDIEDVPPDPDEQEKELKERA